MWSKLKKKQSAVDGLILHLSATIPGFGYEVKQVTDPETLEKGTVLLITHANTTDVEALSDKVDEESERFLGDIFSECPAFSTIVRLQV